MFQQILILCMIQFGYHNSLFLYFLITSNNEKQNTKDNILAQRASILAPLNNTENCYELVVLYFKSFLTIDNVGRQKRDNFAICF